MRRHREGNKQRQGSPCGLSNTYLSKNQGINNKRRPNRTILIDQWECGVCVVKPWRRSSWTPRTDNYKREIHRTDGFHICAAAQPGRLPANHGKRPRTSARNWEVPTKSSAVPKIHRRWRSLKKANHHSGWISFNVPTGGPADRIWASVLPYHNTTYLLEIRDDRRNRPGRKFHKYYGALWPCDTSSPIDQKIGKGERIWVSREAENFWCHDGVKRYHPSDTDGDVQQGRQTTD